MKLSTLPFLLVSAIHVHAQTADPTCATGIPASIYQINGADYQSCCPSSCTACGGPGCSQRPGGSECCNGGIRVLGYSCDTQGPPCLLSAPFTPYQDPTCATGLTSDIFEISGVEYQACCPTSCTSCGGDRCDDLPGGPDNCCDTEIRERGNSCDDQGPPCLASVPEPTNPPPTTTAGGGGDPHFKVSTR
ncbi:unknown protein [Seminavis robusta]|uniref:Uncharacterized protein n=1 Tax=Seminavis robusta TaxID=568900 RepID=A0A9N8HUY0_9STRA|nr:unknown protein [Seminavis robusta]|eukprot:Sro1831_g300350.1 n/a (190) ;mRNA; f:4725-5294